MTLERFEIKLLRKGYLLTKIYDGFPDDESGYLEIKNLFKEIKNTLKVLGRG